MIFRIVHILKVSALLVFSIELLTPLFFLGEQLTHKTSAEASMVARSESPNQIFYLLAEELSANEEGDEGDRQMACPLDFDFATLVSFGVDTRPSSPNTLTPYLHRPAPRRLFLLHHFFLV